MKISIVVPIYNAEKFLDECIQSVISQTNCGWELVLVDDGSTDRSAEICDRYSNIYPDKIHVFHKKNEGQFLSRLFGINQCNGDYVGFLDADDFLEKTFINNLINRITSNNNPDVICFGFHIYNSIAKKITKTVNPTIDGLFISCDERKFVYGEIIDGTLSGSMWSKIFKSSLIKNSILKSDTVTEKRFGEDAFQSFGIMANAKSISYLQNPLYYYRENPDGASQGFDSRDFDYFNTKYVFDLIEQNLDNWNMNTEEHHNILFARNFNETVYFMLKYFRNSKTIKRKKDVIRYDWSNYLLNYNYNDNELLKNSHIRESYINVWNKFKNKQYLSIFLKEIIGW